MLRSGQVYPCFSILLISLETLTEVPALSANIQDDWKTLPSPQGNISLFSLFLTYIDLCKHFYQHEQLDEKEFELIKRDDAAKSKFYYRRNLFRKFFRRLTGMEVAKSAFVPLQEGDIEGYCYLYSVLLFLYILTLYLNR